MRKKYAAYENYRNDMLRNLTAGGVGAEVGTWKGDYARRMITIAKPAELYLIDPYLFLEEYPDRWYGGLEAKSQADMDKIFEAVKSDMAEVAGDQTNITWLRDTSDDAIPAMQDELLDWSYIDGNHSYEFVKRDIENLIPKTKSGGLIMGDDLQWEGIARAVNEVVAENPDTIEVVELKHKYHQFILRKK